MKLLEAMKGKSMPVGEGEVPVNWDWIFPVIAIENGVKELELTDGELAAFLHFCSHRLPIDVHRVMDINDFYYLGVHIKRIV